MKVILLIKSGLKQDLPVLVKEANFLY